MNRFLMRANPNPAFKMVQPLPMLTVLAANTQGMAAAHHFALQQLEHEDQPKFPAVALKMQVFHSSSESPA